MPKPWAKYEIGYIDHDKFKAINSNAICLWIEGKNYCDSRLTDGLIPAETAKHFRFFGPKALAMLTTSCGRKPGTEEQYQPLWEVVEGFGFKMHGYLEHNDNRETALERIAKSEEDKARRAANQKEYRERRKAERRQTAALSAALSVTPVTEPITRDQRSAALPDIQKTELSTQNHLSPAERGRGTPPLHMPGLSGRFKVWRWMLDEWIGRLGDKAEAFDIEAWLGVLDKRDTLLIPANTNWKWLDAQWWDEATRRGLVAQAAVGDDAVWAAATRKGPSVRP